MSDRLVRALVPPSENDLFMVGDAHQRIYGHQVVLSRCGINIKGRGRKLRINYRTTEELKNWASGLLRGLTFDDLDAGFDDADGVLSLVHGVAPVIQTCANTPQAAKVVTEHLKRLLEDEAASVESICLVSLFLLRFGRIRAPGEKRSAPSPTASKRVRPMTVPNPGCD